MTKDNRFLRRVARYIATTGETNGGIRDMSRTWMIFPNKRSIIFARTYLKDALTCPTVMPKMMTLTAFMEKTSGLTEVMSIEALFKLYDSYRYVFRQAGGNPDKMLGFDAFTHPGKMILNDFSDVDAYLIDPEQLFINLKRYKEIKSNFLTPEQKRAVQSILGCCPESDDDHFWRHITYGKNDTDGENDENGEKVESIQFRFIRLWSIMLELYRHYTTRLAEEGCGLKGQIQRIAADKIRAQGLESTPYDQICFVGIDGSTAAIQAIFKTLRDRHRALFFWDTVECLPPQARDADNATLRRLRTLVSEYPMPKSFERIENWQTPEINILGVPSKTMQAKYVGNVLDDLAGQHDGRRRVLNRRADNTAVVMPDSALLTPLMYSISPDIRPLNVTMGLPCRQTPFASLIRRIVSMHLNARLRNNTWTFYRGDIEALAYNYYAQIISANDCIALRNMLNDRQFTYTTENLKNTAPQLAPIFEEVNDDRDMSQVERYFTNVLDTLTLQLARTRAAQVAAEAAESNDTATPTPNGIAAHVTTDMEDAEDEKQDGIGVSSYELRILQAYRDAMHSVFEMARRYNIEPGERSYFIMVERIFSVLNLNFSGTPLSGIQIMGVLETRDLDFDNIIVMSANERVFPRRHLLRSIIPPNLRAGYGLPTAADIESQYGYFLFRLLNCARRAYFVYDSRVGQAGSGEITRYLLQLCHVLPKDKVHHRQLRPKLQMAQPRKVEMPKDDFVCSRLKVFNSDPANGGGYLSPSALKQYLACPLMFFLGSICGFKDDDEVTPYISASTYGTIVHAVMQDIFEARKDIIITKDVIDDILKEKTNDDIKLLVSNKINQIYYNNRYEKGGYNAMPGEGQLMSDFITMLIKRQLEKDRTKTPFVFKAAELQFQYKWNISDDTAFNFKGIIDRIDLINEPDDERPDDCKERYNKLRFIDYKTGNDRRNATSVAHLFESDRDKRNDAIFQLLTYAHAFECMVRDNPGDALINKTEHFADNAEFDWIRQAEPSTRGIKPEIYLIRKSFTDDLDPNVDQIKVGKTKAKPLQSHLQDEVAEFMEKFENIISCIFDDHTPFSQTENQSNCTYCAFLKLCDRKVKSIW